MLIFHCLCSEIPNDDDDDDIEDEIRLADDDIEDLDPDLAKILRETPSIHTRQASKVLIRITYMHNFTQVSNTTKAFIDQLMKPVKIILLDVSFLHSLFF